MKPPSLLSDRDLFDYAEEHLQYEIDMLTWSAGILAFIAGHKSEGYLAWAINSGLLNSFSFHARNLINFLYSRVRSTEYPTDVVLEDYVDDKIVADRLPAITPLLEQALTKANKQVAHLSIDRIQYEKAGKEWHFIDLSKEILAAFRAIAPHVPNGRMSEVLKERLARFEFRIPVVQIEIGKTSEAGPISIKLSLRILGDGRTIDGIPA